MSQIAEKIFYNGNIITINDKQKNVEAVATSEDRIIACGTFEGVKKFATNKTLYIDLKGKTMLPGFIDSHSHVFETACRALWVDVNSSPLGTVHELDDIIVLLQKKAAETPEGEWVVGWGYDDSRLKENRHPNRFDLDKVSTKHPVVISHISGWTSVANSLALEKGSVNKDTKDTGFCTIVRDDDGIPTGLIKSALCPVMSSLPPLSNDDFKKGLKIVSDEYLARGCTTAQEGWWASHNYCNIAKESIQNEDVNIRFVLYPIAEGDTEQPSEEEYAQKLSGEYLDDKNMLCMGARKLTADGSIQAYTACLSTPYHVHDDPSFCGKANYSQETLNDRVLTLHKEGKQVAIHCNGDGAIEMSIIAMEHAQKAYYREDPRFIFVHCQTVRTDQLERIAKLKATISFFVTHTYFWGERHYHRFLGKERALRLDPVQEALDFGINVTLHNDTYVTPINPLLLVWSAVNRQSYEGTDMGKTEQGCSVEDALKALTINAAVQGFEEKEKGSIEVGKLADFTILFENPLAVDSMKIKDLQVAATVVGSRIVHGTL